MINKLALTLIFCMLTCTVALTTPCAAEAPAVPDHPAGADSSPPKALGIKKTSRSPRHISLQLRHQSKALIAGESGTIELAASIKPSSGSGGAVHWDWKAEAPLKVWLSTRQSSGISFIDKANPDRPHHHILVKFHARHTPRAQVLTKKITYSVAPRTKTGNHSFWLEALGKLTTDDGRTVEDAGITTVPFSVDTHLRTKILMLAVVALVVFLFIVEWVRVDVVAIAMMVLLPELGLLNAQDTFRGLSSNAVMAIIGVMIISYGLNRVGLVNKMIQPIMDFVGKGTSRLVVTFSSLIAAISSVMQNTGAAVLFLPAIRSVTTYRLKVHISRVLMPIGMAAILGGTLTMIGTSPLILLNDILPQGMAKFGFLELTPIGLAIVVAGIAYLSTAGMFFLEKSSAERQDSRSGQKITENPLSSYPSMDGPYEVFVPGDISWSSDTPPTISLIQKRFLVVIVALKRPDGSLTNAPHPSTAPQAGFSLCVYGAQKDVQEFAETYGLELRGKTQAFKDDLFNPSWAGVLEGVVSPRSNLIGKTVTETGFGHAFGVNILAVHKGANIYYQNLADTPLESGDILLLHGTWKRLQTLEDLHPGLIIMSPFEQEYHRPEKAKSALFCFLGSLILMVISSFWFQKLPYNPIPLSICLMAGAVGMIIFRVITINEAYHAVDWRTVFLLSGLIPLGMAVDQTGTAQWIATGIVDALGSLMSPLVLLLVLAGLSAAFTLVISNVGACTLLVPLGVSLAKHIGIDPRVAAIVVGLGVSNSFLLPTHQVNALYMGPGEYVTKDYMKIGGILSTIYIVVLVTMTYLFYM